MPAQLDLVGRERAIVQGSTYSRSLAIKEGPVGGPFAARNLTGLTLTADAKVSYEDSAALFSFVVTVTDAVNGLVTLGLTSTVTAALEPVDGVWDLKQDDGAGDIQQLVRGKFVILPQATT